MVLSFMILGSTCKNENIHPCRLRESCRISPLTNLFQGFPVLLCNFCRIPKNIKINGNFGMKLSNNIQYKTAPLHQHADLIFFAPPSGLRKSFEVIAK